MSGRNVTLAYGGHVIYPRTTITNIEGAAGGISGGGGGGTVTYAESAGALTTAAKNAIISSAVNKVSNVTNAASAGIALDLVSSIKSNIINSAVASVPTVTSVVSAASASIAYDLDETIKAAIITIPANTLVSAVVKSFLSIISLHLQIMPTSFLIHLSILPLPLSISQQSTLHPTAYFRFSILGSSQIPNRYCLDCIFPLRQ